MKLPPAKRPANPRPTTRKSTAACPPIYLGRPGSIIPRPTGPHHDVAGQPCRCSTPGGRLRRIGVDVSEQLGYVPACFKVIRTAPQSGLHEMSDDPIFQAAAPTRPISRGNAGAGLLAHVMVSKCATICRCTFRPSTRAKAFRSIDPQWPGGRAGSRLAGSPVVAQGCYVLAAQKVHADARTGESRDRQLGGRAGAARGGPRA